MNPQGPRQEYNSATERIKYYNQPPNQQNTMIMGCHTLIQKATSNVTTSIGCFLNLWLEVESVAISTFYYTKLKEHDFPTRSPAQLGSFPCPFIAGNTAFSWHGPISSPGLPVSSAIQDSAGNSSWKEPYWTYHQLPVTLTT